MNTFIINHLLNYILNPISTPTFNSRSTSLHLKSSKSPKLYYLSPMELKLRLAIMISIPYVLLLAI